MKQLRKYLPLAALLAILLFPRSTLALPEVKCGTDRAGGFWWNYCEHVVAGSTNKDVIYYFHGAYGSEYEWKNSAAYSKIYQLWGASAPTVVTVSYGSIWLLAPRNSSGRGGLYENFTGTALPRLEKTLNLAPEHRMLFGLSMGGFNATQLYFKNPNLFTKVGLACPAILSFDPFSDDTTVQSYITRTNASSAGVYNAIALMQGYFPTKTDYAAADPIALSQTAPATAPALFASIGLQDTYGFFEGTENFITNLKSKGASATLVTVPGPHCSFDVDAMALFFITP